MATLNPGGANTWARARCYQSGALICQQYVPNDGDKHATFQLGPTNGWRGGAASCTAEEGSFSKNARWQVLAMTTFNVW